jgi:hypothetical protein
LTLADIEIISTYWLFRHIFIDYYAYISFTTDIIDIDYFLRHYLRHYFIEQHYYAISTLRPAIIDYFHYWYWLLIRFSPLFSDSFHFSLLFSLTFDIRLSLFIFFTLLDDSWLLNIITLAFNIDYWLIFISWLMILLFTLAFQLERHYWLHFISLRHFDISSFSTLLIFRHFRLFHWLRYFHYFIIFLSRFILILTLFSFLTLWHFDIDRYYCHYITLLIILALTLFHILIISLHIDIFIRYIDIDFIATSLLIFSLLITDYHIAIIFSLYFSIDIILADTLLLTY